MPTSTGWCPFADQRPTTWKKFSGNHGRRAVVLHIAEGTYAGTLQEFADANPAQKSSHFVIAKDGRIAQLVSINDSAWANGLCWQHDGWHTPDCGAAEHPIWADIVPGDNPNMYTISIEHEGMTGQTLTPAMKASQTRLLQWIASQTNLVYAPGHTLIGHRDIDPLRKAFCPGTAFDFDVIATAANGGAPVHTTISATDPILSTPRAGIQQVRHYIANKGGSTAYTVADIDLITQEYWNHATAGGVDPLFALAQCLLETSDNGRPISSWWSQRPRRNPAGIGVTGETRNTDPNDPQNWAGDLAHTPTIWRAGLSFASWDESAKAHIGRLLAYALPAGQGTSKQQALIDFALARRALPAQLRGSASTLEALGAAHNPTGQGWATPGTHYGESIAAIAQAIANT